jgi:8-oxo-dGTP pyrophosphatase MutT (NUDIX family)
MSSTPPSQWDLKENHLHSDCRIFEVYKQRFRRKSDGVEGDFFVLDTNSWVNVLAVTPNKELVLVRQFRFGTQEFSLEPPGGVIEKGEDPIVAGLRELKEETGYVGEDATLIGTARPNAAILSNQCYFVLVENVMKTAELAFDQHEELVTELHPIKNLKAMVQEERITHSIGLNAIFRLLLHLEA